MANVSLQPAEGGLDTEDLIAGVTNGIYIEGDKSWSIDMQRYNFQFTGQRFYKITNGRLDGQLRDVAYRPPRPTSGTPWKPWAARRHTCSRGHSTAGKASRGRSPRSAMAAPRR